MYYMPYAYDSTYLFVILGIIITMLSQYKLKSTYAKYERLRSNSGLSGKEVARKILDMNGLSNVKINNVRGHLSDHYNPKDKSVNLSDSIYNSYSIAAVAVAAHECGHAVQDDTNYRFLNFRSAIFPLATLGSKLSMPLILLGVFLGSIGGIFIQIGIIMFLMAVLFQVITLPVEFNASARAIKNLEEYNILPEEESEGAKKVLFAAALTYVAAAAASILQLFRLILLFNSRRRSDD